MDLKMIVIRHRISLWKFKPLLRQNNWPMWKYCKVEKKIVLCNDVCTLLEFCSSRLLSVLFMWYLYKHRNCFPVSQLHYLQKHICDCSSIGEINIFSILLTVQKSNTKTETERKIKYMLKLPLKNFKFINLNF